MTDPVIALLKPLLDSLTLLLIAIMVMMIVGTAVDMTPTILILTLVLMPLVKATGIDPVDFGVLLIPVGSVLDVVAGVGRMKIDEVTVGVLPFMIVLFPMVLFPSLVKVPARWLYG